MPEEEDAGRLRTEVVEELVESGTIRSAEIEAVMRQVPRHRFAPGVELGEVYSTYAAVFTKHDEHGVAVSSISAPQIQAMMLEQARIEPGMRVLEIGSGGYNAALIAELVGAEGEVTTVDIDPDVSGQAAELLAANGYPQVRVLTVDAEEGAAAHAPYDRILVTAGAWDIPPAWTEQLAEKGRLVVPLRMRSLTRSIAFEAHPDRLVSDSAEVCGFVPMQGMGARAEDLLLVNGTAEIGLRFDDGLPGDPRLLDNAVRTTREEVWTGVSVGVQEPIGDLQLYLATHLPGFCVMAMDPDLDTGLVAPSNPAFSMAAVDEDTGDTFAYLRTRRASQGAATAELGVHALGPHRAVFAARLAEHVRAWDRDQRGGPGPLIEVFPRATPDVALPTRHVIDKQHTRVVFTWPLAGRTATNTGGRDL